MYIPSPFRIEELPAIHDAMRAVRLANLVTSGPDGLTATPLPMLLDPNEGVFGTLYAHLARANSQWRTAAKQDALIIFDGPDAYVSPSWYATKQQHGKVVPTWNYVAIHAYGLPEFTEDPAELRRLVTRLTERHETIRTQPWAVADAPAAYIEAHLRGIVGLRIPITRLDAKHKLSQNRTVEDRAGVKAGFEAEPTQNAAAVAALMAD